MTAPHFELEVETEAAAGLVRFRLRDGDGRQLGAHQVRFEGSSGALWEGVFDTRAHVERYQGGTRFTDRPATAEDLLERLGVFLGEKVLGHQITETLADGVHDRTLLIRLPEITGNEKCREDDRLAPALARVPWEIARPASGEATLMERNVVVRAVTAELDDGRFTAAPPAEGEPLRVLLVFAEAPGSRPLAMRLERETLLDLFYDQVMPRRRVRLDVLCHGVTRERLRRQVEGAGGYHVVHWSGHGHHDLLELYGEDGGADLLSGGQLLGLFTQAGGFLPNLVFLSACLSGTLVDGRRWTGLQEAPAGAATREAAGEEPPLDLPRELARDPGYAGTALALLRAGVPQAIAMRYEVGDAYARDLAAGFYRRLLAQQALKAPAKALALVRAELLRRQAPEHGAVDHATPLVLGRDLAPLAPPRGRSSQLGGRRPRPQPLLPGGSTELDRPASFVGRGGPLTELRTRWLDAGAPAVAVVQGLAGLGKTAVVAEAIHLWHRSFDLVLAFQSKPTPLTVDEYFRRLDQRLTVESRTYRETCQERPSRRVFLSPSPELTGEPRYRLLRDNLLRGAPGRASAPDPGQLRNPARDRRRGRRLRLRRARVGPPPRAHLAGGLPGTGSRLVVTSRHRLAALTSPEQALTVALGPLPIQEAILFLQDNPALRRLAFGGDEGRSLARRLLAVSRGHPLILTRLGTLADDPPALEAALHRLENEGLARLPDVFTANLTEAEREEERRYLEDVAVRSVDLLLDRLTPGARRLLWVVTRASEPMTRALLEGVWSGRSVEQEQRRELRFLVEQADKLPAELRAQLETSLEEMPPAIREALEAADEAPTPLPLGPLLAELLDAGLLTADDNSVAFHELVKERATAWMEVRPEERGGRTEAEVWRAYGERYKARFEELRRSGERGSLDRAAEAGRRGLGYLLRAGAFGELAWFASALVTGTRDPSLLREVIAGLEAVTDQVPAGRNRWRLRANLAGAFSTAGRPDAAFALYEEAAAEAEAAEDWDSVSAICQNWANALGDVGRIEDAREIYERSADAARQAGSPEWHVVASELEALRIDVMQGGAEAALPEIEGRLEEVRGWWSRQRRGDRVREAPDKVILGRALVSALDVAREANLALERWEECLDLLDEIEATLESLGEGEHGLAITHFNRYGPLLRLGRIGKAQRVIEGCLRVFRDVDDLANEARALSALADLWDKRGDHHQAAAVARQVLAVRNRLPDLVVRAISHGNLSNYLGQLEDPHGMAHHSLAAIAYGVVTGRRQDLTVILRNLAIEIRRAAARGDRLELPRLADLLEQPEFDALRQTLAARAVDVGELQETIDGLVEQVRTASE
jgi:tetratricopeptide (TPR) repeat protein